MRRSRGEGSIYKRKDGSWVAEDRDGGKRAYLYGKNRQVVADRLREALKALQDGTAIEQSPMPLEEYLTDWLHSVEGAVRARTHKRYEQLVRVHIVPISGTMWMRNLRPRDLQDLYRRKIEGGLSPRSVHSTSTSPLRTPSGRP